MTEFFRHLRPHWFNKNRMTIDPLPNGGVSFMLVPVSEGVYDFWIYICPETAPFSARTAVRRLRQIKKNGVIRWAQIDLSSADNLPIIDILVSAVTTTEIHSSVGGLIDSIMLQNRRIELLAAKTMNKVHSEGEYEAS